MILVYHIISIDAWIMNGQLTVRSEAVATRHPSCCVARHGLVGIWPTTTSRPAEHSEASPGEAVARSANKQFPASMRHLRRRAFRAGMLNRRSQRDRADAVHRQTQHDGRFVGYDSLDRLLRV